MNDHLREDITRYLKPAEHGLSLSLLSSFTGAPVTETGAELTAMQADGLIRVLPGEERHPDPRWVLTAGVPGLTRRRRPPERTWILASDAIRRRGARPRREVLMRYDGRQAVFLVVDNADTLDVLEALRRACEYGHQDMIAELAARQGGRL